jgi:putative phage-type endonuclease
VSLTAERIQERRQGLGGSDISAALGLSPYKTPLDLYLEKTGQREPDDLSDNRAVEWGNRLEDIVAEKFSDDTGLKVRRNNQLLTHRQHPFLLANIDRAVVGRPMGIKCGLECKTAGTWAAKPELWGDGAIIVPDGDGVRIAHYDDHVPEAYLLQSAHYMAVTDSDMWFLAVLIGGQDFRTYTIRRDLELEKLILGGAYRFWHDHVAANSPPPPSCLADVQALYPRDNGASVIADADVAAACAEAKMLQAEIKEREARLDTLKDRIRMAIGENSTILRDSDGSTLATWKAPKPSSSFDKAAFERTHPELYLSFVKDVQGSRRLLIK